MIQSAGARFIAHGFCMRWQSDLIWLHAVSDAGIVVAYMSIPALLIYFARKRRDVPFYWIFWAFCLFIVSCGLTHAMDVVTLWFPLYRLAGALKALTAVASLGTAWGLVLLMPRLLQIPSTRQLEDSNRALVSEIAQRKSAETSLVSLYRKVEETVEQRTQQLASARTAEMRSEVRFRATFEQAAIGLAHVSLLGKFVLANGRFCEIVGYSSEQLLKMSFAEITHPEDVEAAWALARELLAGTLRQYCIEKRYIHREGHVIWIRLTASLVLHRSVPDYFIGAIEDITARKLADARLVNSERRFKELANAMPHLVWTTDAAGTFDFFNDRWAEVLGNPGYLQHECLEAVMQKQDWQRWCALWHDCLQSGLPSETEYRLWDQRAGEYRWYLGRVAPIPDQEGRTERWVGTATDIHELKKTEHALQESERELRSHEQMLSAIFEEGSIGDFTWDIAKDEFSAHPSVWRMLGVSGTRETGPGRWVRDREDPQDQTATETAVRSALVERGPLEVEFRAVHNDGTIRWIACRARVLRDKSGFPLQVHGFNIDITALKTAEAEVHRREALFRELANFMPQIVWTARADGYLDYYNDRWYELTGFARNTRGDDSWLPILHPDDVAACVDRWYSSVRTGLPYEIEYRFWDRASHEFHWYLGRAIPVRNSGGAVNRWIGTCTDIHDQRTVKESLERQVQLRTIDLQKSLLEKETLLKEVHHRVKNNLQVIYSLLSMQANNMSEERAVAALEDSQRRVLSMAMIHERLYGSEHMDAIDFGEYAESLIEELVNSQGHSGVGRRLEISRVMLNIDQAIPCGLILNELITNALKYAYPGRASGLISVELTEDDSQVVRLTVSDNGAGLPEGFDNKSTKSLGLSIVDILARQIGGSLSASSGPGAVFSLSFPREPKGKGPFLTPRTVDAQPV